MSVGGARGAQQLRSSIATALLAASDAAFNAKFSSFKQVLKKSQTNLALSQHQLVWMKQEKVWRKQKKACENELLTQITSMSTNPQQAKSPQQPHDPAPTFTSEETLSIDSARAESLHTLQAIVREFQVDLRKAKAMLKAAKQQKIVEKAATVTAEGKVKRRTPATMTITAAPSSATSSANSPLASFLSQLATRISLSQQQLHAEESNLTAQLQLFTQTGLERFERDVDGEEEEEKELSKTAIEYAEDDQMEEEKDGMDDETRSEAETTRGPHTNNTAAPSFPFLPPLDPSLLTLPQTELDRLHPLRVQAWSRSQSQFLHVYEEHADQLAYLLETFQHETEKLRTSILKSNSDHSWTRSHSDRLISIVNMYKAQGQKFSAIIERVRMEFQKEENMAAARNNSSAPTAAASKSAIILKPTPPSAASSASTTTRADPLSLRARVDYLERQRTYRQQRLALQTAWDQQQSQLLTCMINELHKSDRAYLKEYEHAREMEEQRSVTHALHSELDVLRQEKSLRNAEQAELAAKKQAELEHATQMKAEQERLMRERQKELLRLYHEHTAAEAAEIAAQVERDRLDALDATKATIDASKPQVKRRQELIAARRDARLAREEEGKKSIAARDARLEAMRLLVAPQVERDAERVMQATEASSADSDANNPLFAVHGYDMSTLLRDKRFRLQLALWTAGVGHTHYAKSMVALMPSAVQPRPDMKSQVFPSRPT